MRVVVIQTAFLGDLVLTLPLLHTLAERIPQLELSVLTTPIGRQLFEPLPFVRRVLVLDKGGAIRKLAGTVQLGRELQALGADVAIVAQRSFRSGALARWSRAGQRIGFRDAAGQWAYTERVPWNHDAHATRRYLDLAEPVIGSVREGRAPVLPVQPKVGERVAELLARHGVTAEQRVLGVAPGATWGTKRWLPGGFADVVRWASERGWVPVLVGSPAEVALCREVATRSGVAPLLLAGQTDIPELAALLQRAEVLVGNDSGPAHVAAAVGTRVLSIFGPTVPRFGYTPYGKGHRLVQHPALACRPCDRHGPQRCPLGHFRCMREVSASSVLTELELMMGKSGQERSSA